jgi:hypothetical protein
MENSSKAEEQQQSYKTVVKLRKKKLENSSKAVE